MDRTRSTKQKRYGNRFVKTLQILTLALLLTALRTSYGYCSESGTAPENSIIFEYVETGFIATEPGYWTDLNSGKLILEGLRGRRLEREHWHIMYDELFVSSLNFAEEQERLWKQAERAVGEERAAWKKELRRERLPGLGAFIGIGYTTDKKVQGVAGIGFVFKF